MQQKVPFTARWGASAFRRRPCGLGAVAAGGVFRICTIGCIRASDPSRVLFVFPDAKHEEQFLGSGSGYRADCADGHSHIYCALEELLTSITGRPTLARRFSKEAA
jgi:hypothetical protein